MPAMAIKNERHQEPVEVPGAMTLAVRLPLMSMTFAQVKNLVGGIHLAETQNNLAGGSQALVAEGKSDTAPGFSLNKTVDSRSNSCLQLLKSMEMTNCSRAPRMYFEPNAEERNLNSTNAIQIYKTPKSKQHTMYH